MFVCEFVDPLQFVHSRLKSYINSVYNPLNELLFSSMGVNTHNRLGRPENAEFCLNARSVVKVERVSEMTNGQLKFYHFFILIAEVVTKQVFAVHLNVTVVFLYRLAEVDKHRCRRKTEVNCIILVKLLNCI